MEYVSDAMKKELVCADCSSWAGRCLKGHINQTASSPVGDCGGFGPKVGTPTLVDRKDIESLKKKAKEHCKVCTKEPDYCFTKCPFHAIINEQDRPLK